jgi:hypothetical protein
MTADTNHDRRLRVQHPPQAEDAQQNIMPCDFPKYQVGQPADDKSAAVALSSAEDAAIQRRKTGGRLERYRVSGLLGKQ